MANTVSNIDYLVEIDFTVYDPEAETVTLQVLRFSRYRQRVVDGNTYEARMTDLSDIHVPYIDRKESDFDEVSLTILNTATDLSADFPFHLLRAQGPFWFKRMRIYLYDATADAKTEIWWGYTKSIAFDPEEITATITASFAWDSIKIQVPPILMGHRCPYNFPGNPLETQPGDTTGGCKWMEFCARSTELRQSRIATTTRAERTLRAVIRAP